MFFRKITSRSNGKEYTYLKLIENYREGDKVKQRVIANLGSMDKLTPEKVNGLIAGLSKICGTACRSAHMETKQIMRYGEVLAIHKIWELLGLDKVIEDAAGPNSDYELLNISLLVELMVINQIINLQPKQSVSDWYKCLYIPSLLGKEFTAHDFCRALDMIANFKEELEKRLFEKLNSLMYINTDQAFCLLTAGMIKPALRDKLNLTSYGGYILGDPEGYQKVNIGMLVSRGGMPLGHRILRETSGDRELRSIMGYLKIAFDIDKCIFVGNRSIINYPNIDILVANNYNYIIGSKSMNKRDSELFIREWRTNKHEFQQMSEDLWLKEIKDGGTRYLLCGNPIITEQMRALLVERLDEVENDLKSVQEAVEDSRSVNGKPVFNSELSIFKDSYCCKYFEWHYDELAMKFSYRRRDGLLEQDADLAGAFLLETNNDFLRGQEILKAYASLAVLAESFSEIKNFESWPNLLHAEQKVSAYTFVCILAAIVEKTMERLMRQAGLSLNARQALLLLEDIKVVINQIDGQEFKSVTNISKSQEDILNAIGLFKEQRWLF